ncbi:MAG: transcriptional regulator [Bdellovibrio sp. CG12_big_fil_rev_8_21_14_0_65_39_13]|nr:MAG: transcriptional regulator [Bdellovibrio sp. CG22_combo_CG10-13_8_21_14_all_39_27]PIQ61474.1 MAG: transcriptional regulator [Bdellovibrio sp. CG12_big_fil_rev_8_21_14_0_65_39_13]PIR35320.1 MAG: transcriptional regulator [Bdellovibrio sp. CG11_big_fil_rev_8_21_14_0_20_39_38]PJB53652.1 MAG: Rrf2 family transcriptional regulator [Bdellovibrio sp. CG_4_9_14_3_um_filter_39_7]
MLRITKKVEYALMALKFMAKKSDGALTSAREICEEFHIPFDTTAKVLQTMNNQGLLTSVKGLKGGYVLEKKLEEISYMDVVKIVEGVEADSFCQNHKGICDLYKSCNIVSPIDNLNRKVQDYLSQLNLGELLMNDSAPEVMEVHK